MTWLLATMGWLHEKNIFVDVHHHHMLKAEDKSLHSYLHMFSVDGLILSSASPYVSFEVSRFDCGDGDSRIVYANISRNLASVSPSFRSARA